MDRCTPILDKQPIEVEPSLADPKQQLDPRHRDRRNREPLEPGQRADLGLHARMILLDQIAQVLR